MKMQSLQPINTSLNAGRIAHGVTADLPESIGAHMNSKRNQRKMIQRVRGPVAETWPIPESLMDFDVPEELKMLPNSDIQFLLHDCG